MIEKREYERPASKPCKHCGSSTVAWQKSKKSGKFYLTEVFTDLEGRTFTDRHEFHSTYCTDGEKHERVQAEILADDRKAAADDAARMDDYKAAAEAAELEAFLSLNDLCERDPEQGRRELESRTRELAAIHANPPTMDYMDDFIRTTAQAQTLCREIEIIVAALDAVMGDDDD